MIKKSAVVSNCITLSGRFLPSAVYTLCSAWVLRHTLLCRSSIFAFATVFLLSIATSYPSSAGDLVWRTLNELGTTLYRKGELIEAEKTLLEAVAAAEKISSQEDETTKARGAADPVRLRDKSSMDTAEEARIPSQRSGSNKNCLLTSLITLLAVYQAEGKTSEAEKTKARINSLTGSNNVAEQAEEKAQLSPDSNVLGAQPSPTANPSQTSVSSGNASITTEAATRAGMISTKNAQSSAGVTTDANTSKPGSIVMAQPIMPSLAVKQAQEVKRMEGHIDWIKALAFSRDSHHGLSGGSDHTVRLWDLNTAQELRHFDGHMDDVNAIQMSPKGNMVASGSDDQTVRIWSSNDSALLHTLKGHRNIVTCVSISPDGSKILSGSYDRTIRYWNLSDGNIIHSLTGHTGTVRCVAFTPDGACALSGGDDNTIRIWDLTTGNQLKVLTGHSDKVLCLAVSADGSKVLSGSRDLSVRLWDLNNGTMQLKLDGHKDWVLKVAFIPGADQAVSASLDKSVRKWDLTAGRELVRFEGINMGIWSVDFSPDTSQILTGSNDKSIRLWKLAD